MPVRRGWKRWRSLIGYLFIIFIAVVAIELHHVFTTNEIKETNRAACARSGLLADNQTFVLQTLSLLLTEEAAERHVTKHPKIHLRLNNILDRLARVPRFDCDQNR